ncbi:MAG: glycosyltransferase [Planctomycetia bacterium]|nr:glycosyltransferase [Planctomycetia bacterium]
MKVLALTEGADHVCCRYRIEAFAGALAERGALLTTLPLATTTWGRLQQFRQAGRADMVILQRKLLPIWQLQLLRRCAQRLIYDFDDALFHRDSYSRKPAESWTRLSRFWATVYAADLVVAGNEYLANRARTYIEPCRVAVLPTCVTPNHYPVARHERQGEGIELVWIGQHSTLPSLSQAEACLAAAADAIPGLGLRVICDRFPKLAGLPIRAVQWSRGSEATNIAAADIGINWLPDDPWSQGKCGLKVLQYMSAGLPVVGNPVGMNREMIVPGETGFLASTPEEWSEAVRQLAYCAALRRRMGAAARALVNARYSVARWSEEFASLILGHGSERLEGTHFTSSQNRTPVSYVEAAA